MGALLELNDVHTYYGAIHALRGVSFTVDEGEIVTLIGSNGAGKSTTLRTISGLLRPRQGEIRLRGERIDGRKPHEIVELGVCQSPEGRRVFARMNIQENLEMGAFSRKDRARAISLYMAGPYLGAGFAFLLGGLLVSYLEGMGPQMFLGMGPFHPWQMTFLLVGAPGLLFAFLMLTVKEPARTEKISASSEAGESVSAFRYMTARWRGFGVLFVGSTCNFAMSTLTFWNVPLFQRVYGWDVVMIGAVTGLFYFTAGPLGTALALWSSKKFGKDREDGAFRTLMLGLLITVPMSALYPIMPTVELAVMAMFLAFIGKSAATAGGPAALQQITPGEMRSRSVAIFNTVITVVGPLLGPPIIGAATDWSGNPASIGIVLSGFVLAIGIPTFVVMMLGRKHYLAAAAEMAGISKASLERAGLGAAPALT